MPTNGFDTVAVAVVAGSKHVGFALTAQIESAGTLSIQAPSASTPDVITQAGQLVYAEVAPKVDGVLRRGLTTSDFQMWVGGQPAVVRFAPELDLLGIYALYADLPSGLGSGSYDLEVAWNGVHTTAAGSVWVNTAQQPALPATNTPTVISHVQTTGLAGLPLHIDAELVDGDRNVTDASVFAIITGPDVSQNTVPLLDIGAAQDGGLADGEYGALAWGTLQPGTYQVDLVATGSLEGGGTWQAGAAATADLSWSMDSDGDGIPDVAEVAVGLDPANPADAGIDGDLDGLTSLQELALGSEPTSCDSDGGGEADGSEAASGRLAGDARDDASLPQAQLSATGQDGGGVAIHVQTADGSGSVLVERSTGGVRAPLGTYPGTGADFTDSPPSAADYSYLATPVSDSGAYGCPYSVGPVAVGSDVTPPRVRISVNEGAWETSDPSVPVEFVDLSEPVVEMRVAASPDELGSQAWIPYANLAQLSLPGQTGGYTVAAQVRDSAGNESEVAVAPVFLTDTRPPTSSVLTLPPETSSSPMDVSVSASDDLTGVAQLTLWWRFSSDGGSTWTTWLEGGSSPASPIQFDFPSGSGIYEFYSIATDGAGNTELPPGVADATTTFVVGAAPTVNVTGQTAITSGSCGIIQGPASPVTTSPAQCVSLILSGDAHADQVIDSIEVRVYGVFGGGGSALLTDWQVVEPLDGAYDSGDESFAVIYPYDDGGWSAFTVDARAFSQGAEGDVSLFVPIDRTPPPPGDTTPPVTHVDQLPGTTRDSSILLTGSAYDDESSWITVEIFYRFRSSNHVAWGDWIGGITFSALPNPSPFSRAFLFPDGKGYYEFYSIGTDESGNVEAPPGSADASIQKK